MHDLACTLIPNREEDYVQTCHVVCFDRTDSIFEQPQPTSVMEVTNNDPKDAYAPKVQEQNII